MASLSSRPWPFPPTWVTLLPSRRSSGCHRLERRVRATHHDRESAVPGLRDAAGHGGVDHGGAGLLHPTASSRLACGLTVLMST